VGHAVLRATEGLCDGALLESGRGEGVAEAIETLVRIRAVQSVSAAEAVGFAFQLKRAVRLELGDLLLGPELSREAVALEERIDGLAGLAFEVYVSCREQIAEIRVGEMRRRLASLIERMGGLPGEETMTAADVGKPSHQGGRP